MHDCRLDFLQLGLSKALDSFRRVKSGATQNHETSVEIELVEVLLWVAAINDRFHSIGGKRYQQWRDASEAGRIVNALRFVRNAYVHSGPEAISLVGGGLTVPITFPIRMEPPSLKWKTLDHLGNTGKPDVSGEALFREVLEGQDVLDTLEQASEWLSNELVDFAERTR